MALLLGAWLACFVRGAPVVQEDEDCASFRTPLTPCGWRTPSLRQACVVRLRTSDPTSAPLAFISESHSTDRSSCTRSSCTRCTNETAASRFHGEVSGSGAPGPAGLLRRLLFV
jgi:hypothetical protein